MKSKILTLLCCLLILISILPLSALAAPLNVQAKCSLELRYTQEGTGFPDLPVQVYRVARANADGSFDLIAPYSGFGVSIHGITSQREWQDVTSTLTSYIAAEHLEPDHTGTTDENGTLRLSDLETGLYLVLGATAENDKGIYEFKDFLVFLPTPEADGSFRYDVQAIPKCGKYTPVTQYSVVKLWKDSANSSGRPSSVTVQILKDGEVFSTQMLSAANNWSYCWTAEDDGSKWTVVEKNIPQGYTVTITSSEGKFTITNSRSSNPSSPPKTGDTFPLIPCVIAMCLSGSLLVILGIWHMRKRK